MRRVRRAALLGASLALAACAGDGRELRPPTADLPVTEDPAEVADTPAGADVPSDTVRSTATTTAPATTAPGATTVPAARIEIELLHSPANATAEMIGTGATATDVVTVDGERREPLSLAVEPSGSFVMQVRIDEEGAHTVCVADTCGRVYTLAPDAESPEEVIAKIEEAQPLAQGYLDYPTVFPDWTVEIGGVLSGTGGTIDAASKTVTIYRNRGREVDDFVRTLLHEFGHVADVELLDDAARDRYRALRGFAPDTPWLSEQSHRIEDWGRQPGEDFAEVMTMIWSDGRWTPRTLEGTPPGDAELAEVAALVPSAFG